MRTTKLTLGTAVVLCVALFAGFFTLPGLAQDAKPTTTLLLYSDGTSGLVVVDSSQSKSVETDAGRNNVPGKNSKILIDTSASVQSGSTKILIDKSASVRNRTPKFLVDTSASVQNDNPKVLIDKSASMQRENPKILIDKSRSVK